MTADSRYVAKSASSLLLLALLSISCRTTQSEVKIHGGELVLSSQRPVAAMIAKSTVMIDGLSNSAVCSGTLISKRIVITAAHCLVRDDFTTRATSYAIRFPVAEGYPEGFSVTVANPQDVVVHSDYQGPSISPVAKNDIAFIRLPQLPDDELPAPYVPVSILDTQAELEAIVATNAQITSRGQTVVASGFGRTSSSSGARDFKFALMELFRFDAENGRIAISSSDSGICSGDSGGPNYGLNGNNLVLLGPTSMGTCDANWDIEVNGTTRSTQLNVSFFTDIRPYKRWLFGKLSNRERSEIELSSVDFLRTGTPRNTDESLGILRYIDSEIGTSSTGRDAGDLGDSSQGPSCRQECDYGACEPGCRTVGVGCNNFKSRCVPE